MKMGRWQTAAARDLAQYLEDKNLSITRFADTNDLDRVQVARAIRGLMPKRVSVDFALAIHRATKGRIRVERWGSETIRLSKAAA